jgi:Spy/CpxP family protein refolding chaperone
MKVTALKATAVAAAAAALLVVSVAHADAAKPAKPSSYAPQPHSKRRVYGAPIQPPIFGHGKSARHAQTSKSHKPKTHTARKGTGKSRKPTEKPVRVRADDRSAAAK